jgi:hypothetical protein
LVKPPVLIKNIEDGLTSEEGESAPEVGENVPDPGGDVTVGDITC